MSGYVRIHRTLLSHPAFRNDGEAMAFAWMVARASWQSSRVRYKGGAINLARGQLAVSVRDLAEALDRPKGWVERLISRLKSETMIETNSETGVNVITICNYDKYQAPIENHETVDGTATGQRQDTEQGREEKKKEDSSLRSESSRNRTPYPCPEGVDPAHWRDFLANRKPKKLTETAYRGIIRDLETHSDAEWPPGRLVQHAAEKGWFGIHDPRKNQNGNHNAARNLQSFHRHEDARNVGASVQRLLSAPDRL